MELPDGLPDCRVAVISMQRGCVGKTRLAIGLNAMSRAKDRPPTFDPIVRGSWLTLHAPGIRTTVLLKDPSCRLVKQETVAKVQYIRSRGLSYWRLLLQHECCEKRQKPLLCYSTRQFYYGWSWARLLSLCYAL